MHLRRMGSALVTVLLLAATLFPASAQERPDAPFTAGIEDAASLKRVVESRLDLARRFLDSFLAVRGARNTNNSLVPYDEMWNELQTAEAQARLVAAVHPDEGMRRTGEELGRAVDTVIAAIQLRPDIYEALQALSRARLDAPARYYVQRELRDFRLAGVDRPEATRARVTQLRDELTAVMAEFQRNLRGRGSLLFVPNTAALRGLPADFIARHTPAANGEITLTTDTIDARPVLTYAANEDLRKQMYLQSYDVAHPQNTHVLDRMLAIRGEMAQLLGYPNWASYDMESRMARDVNTVSTFIDRVVAAAGPKAAREYAELVRAKQQDAPGAAFQAWDRPYYSELVRRASYDFDSQSVRPYFAFDRVLPGVLDVTGKMFGVSYRPVSDVPVWHPSVRVFEMRADGKLAGRVYLDLHPRPNKRASGANVTTVRQGQEGRSIPEAVLVASLPGGQPGDPGLMTHEEVRTLFHEFGHVIHRLLGGHQKWYRLSSLAMERDFVEAPSQMLEEWTWDPRTLASFATHYLSGEPIPARVVLQMRRASEFGQGLEVRSQMMLARVSLSYHDRDPRTVDTTALWKEIHNQYMPFPHADGTHRQAAFTHLGNPGYASAYYTYMWSLVIAKDLFSTFDGADLLAPGSARRYRDVVFAPGSAKPAAEVVRDFLGRPFNFEAWERWLNRETPPVSTN